MRLNVAQLDPISAGITIGGLVLNFKLGNWSGNALSDNLSLLQKPATAIRVPSMASTARRPANGRNNTRNNAGIGIGNNNIAYLQPIILFGRDRGAIAM